MYFHSVVKTFEKKNLQRMNNHVIKKTYMAKISYKIVK